MSATAALREELAHVDPGPPGLAAAELAAALRFGGVLTLSGGGVGFAFTTTTGPVARRVRAALDRAYRVRPAIEVHQPGGLVTVTRYVLRAAPDPAVGAALTDLGLLDADGRPREGAASAHVLGGARAAAYARGALMAAGSLSAPGAAPHLEVRAPGAATAEALAAVLARLGGAGAWAGVRTGARGEEWRVVVKSGAAAAAVLARVGAHAAFLRTDAGRLRRELRGDANRAANADRANLSRTVSAAARQTAAVRRALDHPRFDELSPPVRAVALARLANPEASLAELGALLDPPVGKATVHRRLERLETLLG